MGQTALSIGADTFQFFTRNPRGSRARQIDPDDAQALMDFMDKNHFARIIAHAPYTLNPCSSDDRTRQFALDTMKDDLARMEFTPGQLYNFHPGSHTGQGIEKGIEEITLLLNSIITEDQSTTVLLETMAGKGTEVGSRFEEIRAIIDGVRMHDKIGVCMDTCHIFDAGYDIRGNWDKVLSEFDRIIGIGKLKAIHLNDSMNTLGSHKDRHQRIGEGGIGLEALQRIAHCPALSGLPFCLETPNDLEGYRREIELLSAK